MSEAAWLRPTWSANRTAQHKEFMALPFREKLLEIERMGDVVAVFEARRVELGLPVRGLDTEPSPR